LLTNEDLARLRRMDLPGLKVGVLPMLFRVTRGEVGLLKSMEELRIMARRMIEEDDVSVLILSDRGINRDFAPVAGTAGRGRTPPLPDPRGHAHPRQPGARDRRGARGAIILRC